MRLFKHWTICLASAVCKNDLDMSTVLSCALFVKCYSSFQSFAGPSVWEAEAKKRHVNQDWGSEIEEEKKETDAG